MRPMQHALEFLYRELKDHPYRTSVEMLMLAELERITISTFRRALRTFSIKSERHPRTGDWILSLPRNAEDPTPKPVMTAAEIKETRNHLGLSQSNLGLMLGWDGPYRTQNVWNLENGRTNLSKLQHRMLEAYARGYRPKDWPNGAEGIEDILG